MASCMYNGYTESRIASALDAPVQPKNRKGPQGPLSRFSQGELKLPFRERHFRDLVRCGQFTLSSENPIVSLGKIGCKVPKSPKNPESKYWKSVLNGEIKGLAAANEWEKIALLEGELSIRVGEKYYEDGDNRSYWWGALQQELEAQGRGRAGTREFKVHGMDWLARYYGSVHGAAEEFSIGDWQEVMPYNKVFGNDLPMLMAVCDEFHEALRKKDGSLTSHERVVLLKHSAGHQLDKRDIDVMRQIYRDPASWKTRDFDGTKYAFLFSKFGRSAYKVVQFQCSRWFELLVSRPNIPALYGKAGEHPLANGKKAELSLTSRDEERLQKEDEMVETGGYKIRNRNGMWELHRAVLPWEMDFSPQGWHRNKEMFSFNAIEAPSGALAAWLEALRPSDRKSILGLTDGSDIYFWHEGKEFHAARRQSRISIEEDCRHMIVKFVEWAEEEMGIMPYRLYGRTIHKLAASLEEHISNAIIVVKMAHPEIMPQDMARVSTLNESEIRKKAQTLYPDWDEWFLHHYPEHAGRNDGIVKFGSTAPALAKKPVEELGTLPWKGKKRDANGIPLPSFDGKNAKLLLEREVEKFFIEAVGSYSVNLTEAMGVAEVAQQVMKAREDAERKGFLFGGKAEKAAIRAAVKKMIDAGSCLRLAKAGAIRHNIPEWYVEDITHGRFWLQAVADKHYGGDIYQVGSGKINKAGLGRYLKCHGMSPNKILQHYFSDEIDPSRLRKRPTGLARERKNGAG